MSRRTSTANPNFDHFASRQDLLLGGIFSAIGLAAVIASGAGIQAMIAGSVGSVGGGCVAVGLTLLDSRLNYAQRAQASLPIVAMLASIGFVIKENVWALAGFPLLLLGLAGLLPGLARWSQIAPAKKAVEARESAAANSTSTALPN